MQNLFDDLEKLLATNEALIDEDRKLIKNAVIDRATRLDPDFLKMLLSSDTIRAHFFANVEGTLVFDKVKFAEFVSNKAFLPDSYTAFRNRIGLANSRDRYLKDSRDVVLAWPYKDCVLEGGMTKEDAKRDEIFWNTTLAPDDITRLFEPKALTAFERWDAEAVAAGKPKPVGEIGADDNLLIKGNNLLAMHSLKARYAGQVKLIYIDPPYNTGSDSFRYNDRFNISAWLTFMKNRLEVVKELLRPDGVIIVQLSDHRVAEGKIILDEIFGRENFINQISIRTRSPSGFKTVNLGVFESAEYLLLYGKDKRRVYYQKQYQSTEYDGNYKFVVRDVSIPVGEWVIDDIRSVVIEEMGQNRAGELIEEFGDRAMLPLVAQFALANAERVFRPTTINDDAAAGLREVREASKQLPETVLTFDGSEGRVFVLNGQQIAFYSKKVRDVDGVRTPSMMLTNIWQDIPWEGIASEGGVKLKQGKKPERLIRRLLMMYSSAGDLVLDYFGGSGTTAAVAQKMARRFISIEQLDYGKNDAISRLTTVVKGDPTGISKLENWRGGGSFVYLELAEWNEALGRRIREAADDAALERVTADMRANGYWRYSVDQALWDWDVFAKLDFDERKRMLLDGLDANHLYVNYGDIADAAYGLSAEDIAVNNAFYEGEA